MPGRGERARRASDFDVIAAFARALLAFVEEDRAAARRHLELAAVALPQASGDQATGPAAGLLALLLAVDGDDAAWTAGPSHEPVHFLARGFLRYAEAVVAGRAGDVDGRAGLLLAEATSALAERARGTGTRPAPGRRGGAGRRVGRAGGVARGMRLRSSTAHGDDRIASACRSLLRKAGAPVPRRRGEEAACRRRCAALGVTARELEVLRLLGEGLSNKEIGRPAVPVAPHGRAPHRQPHGQGGRERDVGARRLRRSVRRP